MTKNTEQKFTKTYSVRYRAKGEFHVKKAPTVIFVEENYFLSLVS